MDSIKVNEVEENCKTLGSKETSTPFKKPVLVGKIGRLPRKMTNTKNTINEKPDSKVVIEIKEVHIPTTSNDDQVQPFTTPAQQLAEKSLPLPYKEPKWSGLPQKGSKDYVFDVLKSGVIIDQINVMSKPFWVFGRSPNCEITMSHPTISRYHVVLQYRNEATADSPVGFYIYDLGSTHGTFLNKGKLKSRVYAPIKVGHMLKMGFSTRYFVLTGPEEDAEKESEQTLTELKQERTEKLLKQELLIKEALEKEEKEQEEKRKKVEARGVDWGLGEDADEETDLTENPYAQTNNEELYIDDPKKALRGFMEREGYNLEYNCSEQGFGQFLCKVELPLDDDRGRPIVAEVLHKGKKKEAVIQCALEACRILDRHGVLRQATHESRKRKAVNWEEKDYYDSDEDTFLDRTGSIEKKREKRMKSKIPQQPETYQSLLEKETNINVKIAEIEARLSAAKMSNVNNTETVDEDSLDIFMKGLKESKPDKQVISKLKAELAILKIEHTNIMKLVNLAKPADLPPLVISKNPDRQNFNTSKCKTLPLFGKRSKIKVQLPQKSKEETELMDDGNDSEEYDEGEGDVKKTETPLCEVKESSNQTSTTTYLDNEQRYISIYKKICEFEKLVMENKFPSYLDRHISDITSMLQNIKGFLEETEKCHNIQSVSINAELKKQIEADDEGRLLNIYKELQRIYLDIQNVTDKQSRIYSKIRILGLKNDLICEEILQNIDKSKMTEELKLTINKRTDFISSAGKSTVSDSLSDSEENRDADQYLTLEELEKRRKRNQRRILHRKERAEIEKQKGYREDAQRKDYNMWVPPGNQSGDGRTSLNEKYGY